MAKNINQEMTSRASNPPHSSSFCVNVVKDANWKAAEIFLRQQLDTLKCV